jgi:ferrous iron transport protein B
VVPTVGHKGQGVQALLDAVVDVVSAPPRQALVSYGAELEEEIGKLAEMIEQCPDRPAGYDSRWLALKVLELDEEVRGLVSGLSCGEAVLAGAEASARHLRTIFGVEPDLIIADQRYGFISGLCHECVSSGPARRVVVSDKIDRVVCNALLGLPIFALVMFLLFQLTFTVAAVPVGWLESLKEWLSGAVNRLWAEGSASPLRSLVVDGVIGGVGNVIVFLPNILMLFLTISILEDSGYMARAAFVMERLMNRVGLHGKSFIPLLLGFGCTVPAIMATRVLESRRDRLTTMLVLPLMSCSARVPIYGLFAGAFFPLRAQGWVTSSLYFLGVVLAILIANLLRRSVFRGESVPFVMELPPYRLPTLKGSLIHMWERGRFFLRKAGTVIFAATVILWAISSFPRHRPAPGADRAQGSRLTEADAARQLEHSIAGRIGRGLAVVMRPLGFDWRICTALIGGTAAKELFVSQLGVIYSLSNVGQPPPAAASLSPEGRGAPAPQRGEERAGLGGILRAETYPPGHARAGQKVYTPLKAYTIMLFCLISAPCLATVAVTRRESGSWGWAILQWAGLMVLAYVVAGLTYQVGMLLGLAG